MVNATPRFRSAKIIAGFGLLALSACSGTSGEDESVDGSQADLEGTLETVVVGNAERTAAHLEFFLEDSKGAWTKLLFDEHPELVRVEDGHQHLSIPGRLHEEVTSSAKLRVTGVREGDKLQVSSFAVLEPAPSDTASIEQALIAASPRKVAVILANFANDTSQPITPAAARDIVFGSTTSANAYYQSNSFGIRSLVGKLAQTGDVFGWYTIAANNNPCDYSAWGSAARAAAQAAGVDLSGYDHIIHYFPRSSVCGWSGVGQVPGKYTWINGSNAQTISHELGHNFGSHHAASLICTDANGARVSISPTCSANEYGNPFDVMGSGFRHMTGFNKGRVGFLEPANTAAVSADGTFTIAPLEFKSTATQVLRIPIDTTRAYYVEFRQPQAPFDNFATTSAVVNGVLITRAPLSYSTVERPQLIDMAPSTTSFTDAALKVGQTFSDPVAHISIKLNSVSTAGAVVSVDMP
jgi:hypothetical protein